MTELAQLRAHLATLYPIDQAEFMELIREELLAVAEAAEATAAWSRWPAPTPLERMVDHRVAEKALLSSTAALNAKITELLGDTDG